MGYEQVSIKQKKVLQLLLSLKRSKHPLKPTISLKSHSKKSLASIIYMTFSDTVETGKVLIYLVSLALIPIIHITSNGWTSLYEAV